MTASEWLWTKVGFGLVAALAGSIWAIVFYPIVSALSPAVPLGLVWKAFVGTFVAISFVNHDWIGKAGIGAAFALVGIFYGFLASGGHAPVEFSWRKHGKELIVCFALGMTSTLLILLL